MSNNFFRCKRCGQVEQVGGKSDENYNPIVGGGDPPEGLCGDCWGHDLAAKTPPKATVTEAHVSGESAEQKRLRLEHAEQQARK